MSHSPKHWHLAEDGSEMIEADLYKGKLDKYVATTNLRAFYMELREILVDWYYKDLLGSREDKKNGDFFGGEAKRGEFVENKIYENRTADMFEKRFMWSKKADSTVEFELIWEARYKTPFSDFGWLEVKIYLVCRRIVNTEILEGNVKKILQQGAWEFRNEFVYKNNVVHKYLNNVPFVKDSKALRKIYLDHMYKHTLDHDVEFCEHELMPIIQNLIKKYFISD